MINLKRAYDPANSVDGTRLLIERLWPRGVKKTSLKIKSWIKDVASSTELRKWFSHDPAKWDKISQPLLRRTESQSRCLQPIIEAARHGAVTLIYSSQDTEHNNAVALQEFLQQHMHKKTPGQKRAA